MPAVAEITDGASRLMRAGMDTFLFLFAVLIAVSFPLLWQWDRKMQRRKKETFRRQAYERLVSYRSRSDDPKYEFAGKDATVVLRKEKFIPMDGQLAGTFIFLCRNAFNEYFFA